jgi:DNA-directed RNA polymerase specialized sigma24 family protein
MGELARRMLADAAAGREPDPEVVAAVSRHVRAYVARAFPELDADDIVQVTLMRMLGRGGPAVPKHALGYVIAIARNVAIDELRAHGRRSRMMSDIAGREAGGEDLVATQLDRETTRQAVVEGLRASIAAGDATTVRVITTWLDAAEELGDAPSTREVAERAGVSHTTVGKSLRRFRALLAKQ